MPQDISNWFNELENCCLLESSKATLGCGKTGDLEPECAHDESTAIIRQKPGSGGLSG